MQNAKMAPQPAAPKSAAWHKISDLKNEGNEFFKSNNLLDAKYKYG
jgi:hypothetical protein